MIDYKKHPIIEQYIAWNKFGVLLGMDFEVKAKGNVIYTMPITEKLLATPFVAHGGSVSSLLDAALGVACLTQVCEEMKIVSTVSLSIHYIAPAKLNDVLSAEAKVLKSGKKIQFVEGTVMNQDGVLIATASATMNAYPVSKISKMFF